MIRISVVIITFNEENNIGRCIDSVKNVADEIVVVDSFSKDNTRTICEQKGVRFIENAFLGHIQQKNFAMLQANYEFILSLDADEFLSPALEESILKVKANSTHQAYSMNRLSSLGGKWIYTTDWYPDRKLRLWNKQVGKWGGYNPHDRVILQSGTSVKHLRGNLMHNAYDGVESLIRKAQHYALIFAREHRHRMASSHFKIFYKSIFTFFRNYVIRFGALSGYKGLLISFTNTYYTFYKYAILKELNENLKTSLVITTYNRKDALELVLLSVLNQSMLPNEVIVADDGSRDDTRQLVERYAAIFPVPLIHCWHEDEGFRLSAIRNRAIAMARHEYIIMIDGDIILHPDFIQSHRKHARRGVFIQGSRVLLMKEQTERAIRKKITSFTFFSSGIQSRLNALYIPWLSNLISYKNEDLHAIRGANLSFWRDDINLINGFNEDFQGWGREDNEFMVRMNNNDIQCVKMKLEGFGFHLYHPESSRAMLPHNQLILDTAIATHSTRCKNGIDKYQNELVVI
jgi:glycosyltransferase involved in cell wall biosynthesis